MSRILLRLAAATLAWGVIVFITGGFVAEFGSVRISSRNSRNSLIIAAACLAAGLAVSSRDRRRRLLADWHAKFEHIVDYLEQLPRHAVSALAAAFAIGTIGFGIVAGSIDAGGSDVLGYVSEAELWLKGSLRVEQPIVSQVTWEWAIEALTPLGYKPGADRVSTVPACSSPGLPLAMAGLQWLWGRAAVFLVVPLLGGLLAWSTYKLGARVGGEWVGLAASVLTITSPAVLFHLMLPMSDVPVAAWWALSLWLVLIPRPLGAFGAGLAAGAAVLTRPNHVFYVPILALYLLWLAVRERPLIVGVSSQRLTAFTAGVVPFCLAVAAINDWVYGSPLVSGSGTLDQFYSLSTVVPNLRRYGSWMFESNTPAFVSALTAPFLVPMMVRVLHRQVSRAVIVMLLAFGFTVIASYLVFFVFEDWVFLRYMLAAFPPMWALASLVLMTLLRRFRPRLTIPVMVTIVLLLALRGYGYAEHKGAFGLRVSERRYSATGNYINRKLPENAAFISLLHSGSARYYTGRLTVRFDWLRPDELDRVLADLRRLGYRPYILLDLGEDKAFRERFAAGSPVGALDWPPLATQRYHRDVWLYDPDDSLTPEGRRRVTELLE